jgi:hypothetical protein
MIIRQSLKRKVNRMKKTFAIAFSEQINEVPNKALGSIVIAGVVVDTNFFRKFAYLKPTIENMDKFVERSRKACWSQFTFLQPDTLKKDKLLSLYADGVISIINSYKEFWKETNVVIAPFGEPAIMLEAMEAALPHNLKNIKDKLNMPKWKFEGSTRAINVATLYAMYMARGQHAEMKKVWGEIGSGAITDPVTLKFIASNPDCPHLRKL